MEVDSDYRLVGFEEKPVSPRTIPGDPTYALASMGVYLFRASRLRELLSNGDGDFGKHIIPKVAKTAQDVFVYDYELENRIEDYVTEVRDGRRQKVLVARTRDSSYWKDVGTIDSYYNASMDLVGVDPLFNLYGEKWLIRTHQRPLPPSKCVIGGRVEESIVSDGCIISGGAIRNTILSPGVVIEREAYVRDSIIFDDVIIEPRANIRRAIVDKEVKIRSGISLGFDAEIDRKRGCTITDSGIVVVPKGLDVAF